MRVYWLWWGRLAVNKPLLLSYGYAAALISHLPYSWPCPRDWILPIKCGQKWYIPFPDLTHVSVPCAILHFLFLLCPFVVKAPSTKEKWWARWKIPECLSHCCSNKSRLMERHNHYGTCEWNKKIYCFKPLKFWNGINHWICWVSSHNRKKKRTNQVVIRAVKQLGSFRNN